MTQENLPILLLPFYNLKFLKNTFLGNLQILFANTAPRQMFKFPLANKSGKDNGRGCYSNKDSNYKLFKTTSCYNSNSCNCTRSTVN